MRANNPMKKVSVARRKFITAPITVKIIRKGILYYIVKVQKGANTIQHGYNHDLTTLPKARKKAKEMIETFKTLNSNYRVQWKEILEGDE